MGKSLFKRIIVVINGKESSIHAVMYAIMMSKSYNSSLKFVYVVDVATIKYLALNNIIISDSKTTFEENLSIDGENYLNYAEMLASKKGIAVQKELRKGAVSTEVLKAAEEFNADLILLGANEKNNAYTVKNTVLTHQQNEIIVNSKCPVMIVQKPDIEKLFNIF